MMDESRPESSDKPCIAESEIKQQSSLEKPKSHLSIYQKLMQLDPKEIGQKLQSSGEIGGKLDELSDLFMDNNVKAIIKSVAGQETHSIIEDAVLSIKQNNSLENKQRVITNSVQKIHSTLKKSDLSANKAGPAIDLIMSLVNARGKHL